MQKQFCFNRNFAKPKSLSFWQPGLFENHLQVADIGYKSDDELTDKFFSTYTAILKLKAQLNPQCLAKILVAIDSC